MHTENRNKQKEHLYIYLDLYLLKWSICTCPSRFFFLVGTYIYRQYFYETEYLKFCYPPWLGSVVLKLGYIV